MITLRLFAFLALVCISTIAIAQPHALQVFNTSNSPLPEDNIRALAIAPDSTLWVGTEYGLATLKNGSWDSIDTLQGYQIRAIAFDTAGHAWVGTFLNGLWVQTDTGWVNHTTANSTLPDNYVRTISFCPNGTAWVGTVGGAVSIANSIWEVYRASNTNWFVEHIASSYCAPNNQVWLGGLNTGLMRQQDTTWVIYRKGTSGLPDNTILDIKGNTNGDLLIAMPAAGTAVFDGNQGWIQYNTITSYNPSNSINRIAVGNNGNIYFASANKGLIVYQGGLNWFNLSSTAVPDTSGTFLPSNDLVALLQDNEGVIWASAVNEGLLRIEFVDTINGLSTLNSRHTISIYPNPAQEYFIVESPYSIENITITDVLGQIVFTTNNYTPKTKVPLSNVPKGTYMVMLQLGSEKISQRLIKY